MTQTTLGKQKGPSVSELINEQKVKMQASGKYYFICAICGKIGPLIASTDLVTGKVTINLERADNWPVKVVSAEGKSAVKIITSPCLEKMTAAFTTVRICPQCARRSC